MEQYTSKVKFYRTQAGMTQKQLSDASRVNIRQIQAIESGKIKPSNMSAKNLLAIADALEVDPHLLTEDMK